MYLLSPLGAQRFLRLHRLLLRLEAEVLDVNAEAVVKPLQEAAGQGLLRFV